MEIKNDYMYEVCVGFCNSLECYYKQCMVDGNHKEGRVVQGALTRLYQTLQDYSNTKAKEMEEQIKDVAV